MNSGFEWYLQKALCFSSKILALGTISTEWWRTWLLEFVHIYMIIMSYLLLGSIRYLDRD